MILSFCLISLAYDKFIICNVYTYLLMLQLVNLFPLHWEILKQHQTPWSRQKQRYRYQRQNVQLNNRPL